MKKTANENKYRGKIRVILLSMIMVLLGITPAFAADPESEDIRGLINSADFTEIKVSYEFDMPRDSIFNDNVRYIDAVKINDKEYTLYPVFVDVQSALNEVKDNCPLILEEMKDQLSLNDFAKSTVKAYNDNYYLYMQHLYDENKITNEKEKELSIYEGFMDIYENEEQNKDIKSMLSLLKKDGTSNIDSFELMDELQIRVPYNTGIDEAIEEVKTEAGNSDIRKTYNKNGKFNVSDGVEYAEKYAVNPNVKKYSTCAKGDCTNFTSQIKHAGGVPFYKKYGEKGAWAYKVIQNTTYPTNAYSARWCGADKFAKFFGVKSKYLAKTYHSRYKAFSAMAENVKKGSFIALDVKCDGDWNHMGFVTHLHHKGESTRRTIKNYHGHTYKDFKVAEHTKNYHKWVSDSGNGWEEQDKAVNYGIIN